MRGKINLISLSQLIELSISFLIAHLLITQYTVEDYGVWSHFIRASSILIVIFSFEINSNFLYRQSGRSNISLNSNLLLIIFFYFFLFIAITIILSPFDNFIIKNLFNYSFNNLFLIFFLYHILTNIYYQLFESYFLIKDRYYIISYSIIIKQLIKIVLIITFIGSNEISKLILYYIFFDSFLTFINFLIVIFNVKIKYKFSKKKFFHFFKVNTYQSKYIFLGSCFTSIFLFIDNYYIIKNLNYSFIAIYSLYLGINGIMIIIISISTKIFTPVLSMNFNKHNIENYKSKISEAISFVLFWLFPMAIGLNIIAGNLIDVISQGKIEIKIGTFLLFSIFQIFLNFIFFLRNLLNIENKSKFYASSILIALIINILLIYYFKPVEINQFIYFKLISLALVLVSIIIILKKNIIINSSIFIGLLVNLFIMLFIFGYIEHFKIFISLNNITQIFFKTLIFGIIYLSIDLAFGKYSILRKFYIKDNFFINFELITKNILKRLFAFLYIVKKFKVNKTDVEVNQMNEFMKLNTQIYRYKHINIINKKNPLSIIDFGCSHAHTLHKLCMSNKKIKDLHFIDLNIEIFKNGIYKNFKSVNKDLNLKFYDKINENTPKVDFIFTDAVFMYLNIKETKNTLEDFFMKKPATILIHDFSYDNFINMVSGFFLDDKNIKSLTRILKEFATTNNYNIQISRSEKDEDSYKKYGYDYLLEKKV